MTMNDDRRPVFAANWKMHKGPDATRQYVEEFARLYEVRPDRHVVFFPPAVSLEAFRGAAAACGRPDLELGAQDVHTAPEGAHTSAISAPMVAEAGAAWSLAGHSERRREFGDDDATVAAKTRRILDAALIPVVCVGETLEERDAGNLRAVLERQVTTVLAEIAPERRGELTWAYEPVWAIGTGRTASPADASEAHAIVRGAIAASAGGDVAAAAVILYGGSVKPGNIDELMAAAGVDGVLVGGASLEPPDFAAICACRAGSRR